jgi:F0F1-type ATP synthase assembly protein I
MTQLTPADLVRILGHVTLILVVPMVGGTVLGLVLDAMLATSPLLVLSGLAVGSLVAATGIWLYIRSRAGRYGGPDGRADGR